jgi:phospholipid transport system transporter-binding protein
MASESRLTQCRPDGWRLSGALNFGTVTGLLAEMDRLLREQARQGLQQLEIDLSDLGSANSAGLAFLLECAEMARERGIHLTYHQLPNSLNRIAAFSNLQPLLPLTPHPE